MKVKQIIWGLKVHDDVRRLEVITRVGHYGLLRSNIKDALEVYTRLLVKEWSP